MAGAPHLRVARPSDEPHTTARFYVDVLGFVELARFEDHDGFDGVVVGRPGWPWHLEFTRQAGASYGEAPNDDHLLVIYEPTEESYRAHVERAAEAGHHPVRSRNPYWDDGGVTFEDPDGYRVVVTKREWQRGLSRPHRQGAV